MERIGSIILKYNAFILSSVKIILFVEGKKNILIQYRIQSLNNMQSQIS